jgi:hypothetical protein
MRVLVSTGLAAAYFAVAFTGYAQVAAEDADKAARGSCAELTQPDPGPSGDTLPGSEIHAASGPAWASLSAGAGVSTSAAVSFSGGSPVSPASGYGTDDYYDQCMRPIDS